MGEWREPPYLNPPSGRALDPSPTVGELREASYLNPPSGRATPLTRGVALVHGGQRPISLEYQINRLPPIISDTLVTGMVLTSHG